jgi:pimeloyl-ACP methyl ester carboxylesterase
MRYPIATDLSSGYKPPNKTGGTMKFILLFALLTSATAHAEIEFNHLTTPDGSEFQTCSRYPDPVKFPGKRPVLMFIQGSGLYDTCLRLERPWGTGIVERGVIVFSRQKRGVKVVPATGAVDIDRNLYIKNDLVSLKADSVQAYESLLTNAKVEVTKIAVAGGSEGTWMATEIGLRHPEVKEVSLISSAMERFDTAFERQVTNLIPFEIISSLDLDKSGKLSEIEIPNSTLITNGLRSFNDIDINHDRQIDANELAAEIRRAVNFSLATNDSTFFISDFGGGVSVPWLQSAYREKPLAPNVLQLSMPVYIHHGRADINATVEPVYDLEQKAQKISKTNLSFSYYDGLGHELTKDILYQILFDIADRISK